MDTSSADHKLANQGKKVLNELVRAGLADEASVSSILNLVDPFPDDSFVASGWPDSVPAPVNNLDDCQEYTVVSPAGLAPSETWDLHILLMPMSHQSAGYLASNVGFSGDTSAGPISTAISPGVAPLTVITARSGDLFDPLVGPTTSNPVTGTIARYDHSALLGYRNSRLTCQGVEVINTSPLIARGGMGYAYRMPLSEDSMSYSNPSGVPTLQRIIAIGNPPTNPADITLYGNTYKGTAEHGIVTVNMPTTKDNPFRRPMPTNLWRMNSSTNGSFQAGVFGRLGGPTAVYNWGCAGVFITGLVPGATFTVRYRAGFEIVPTPSQIDRTLVSLSTRSVPYHPMVDEIISRIIVSCPAGFDYRENPLGEWLSRILGTVAKVAPVIGDVLGNILPGASILGKAIGTGASAIQGITHSTQKKLAAKPTALPSSIDKQKLPPLVHTTKKQRKAQKLSA